VRAAADLRISRAIYVSEPYQSRFTVALARIATMTHRRLLLLALPVALVLLGVGAWAMCKMEANTIRPGMTMHEVEARLGTASVTHIGAEKTIKVWGHPDESLFMVIFDRDGIAIEIGPNQASLLDQRWLRW
jgi:hypothetical protein